jgi:hypothetical protein
VSRYVLLFFMDGVGLGGDDPEVNPFLNADLPHLTRLLEPHWFLQRETPLIAARASLIPTDAGLGVAGRPQSATGQAALLTGRNVPRLVGGHYGPKPNEAVAEQIRRGTLFHEVVAAGGNAALLTPYPQGYFDAIASGRRLYSAVPLAATSAGVRLRTADDLRRGRAVSPMFTGQAWRDHLGYDDIPLLSLPEAGRRIAALAADHTFSFFEHWPSDRAGHRGTMEAAAEHLEMLDTVLGALIEAWDDDRGLLIVTSDHGNIEAKDRRQHTENPVPTLLVGGRHAEYAAQLRDLTDVAAIARDFLTL